MPISIVYDLMLSKMDSKNLALVWGPTLGGSNETEGGLLGMLDFSATRLGLANTPLSELQDAKRSYNIL